MVLIVNNLSAFAQPAALDLHDLEGKVPVEMLGNHAFPRITKDKYQLSLSPHSFFWFRIEDEE